MEENQKSLHAIIKGRVQGVGFRYFVQSNATRLGLTGWVRNKWDGSVELIAEGKHLILEEFLIILWRGPRSSHVTDIKSEWSDPSNKFRNFRVRFTS